MELLSNLGIDPNDGILIAYLPRLDSVLQEYYKGSCKVYAQDGIVLDMLDADKPRVKWWRVREAARQLGMGIVEPMWSGSAYEAPAKLAEIMERVRPLDFEPVTGAKLFMRAFSHGPWICLDTDENKRVEGILAAADLAKLDPRFEETARFAEEVSDED